jgi:hypothetical protein
MTSISLQRKINLVGPQHLLAIGYQRHTVPHHNMLNVRIRQWCLRIASAPPPPTHTQGAQQRRIIGPDDSLHTIRCDTVLHGVSPSQGTYGTNYKHY